MKRWLIAAAALALALVSSSPSFAQVSREGDVWSPNAPSGWPFYTWDGTKSHIARSDPNGILRVTEEYPFQFQAQVQTLCGDSTLVISSTQPIGAPIVAYPYRYRSLNVTVTRPASGSTAATIYLYLYGSNDQIYWSPVYSPFGTAAQKGFELADTSNIYARQAVIPISGQMAPGGTSKRFTFSLPTEIYEGRYLTVYAKTDSNASQPVPRVGVAFWGRVQ